MATSAAPYRTTIGQQEEKIAHFLRTFEAQQEKIHLAKIHESKQALFDALGDLFPPLNAELEGLTPPAGEEKFHQQWKDAVASLEDAYTSFLSGSAGNFMAAYFQSRHAFSQGKYQLYSMRTQLPTVHKYWVLPEAAARLAELETPASANQATTGVLHRPVSDQHGEYSLYVPEHYDPNRRWPLIIALHGGHGRGDDYLLTWLRSAKSNGYIVLSPKSLSNTWSLMQPSIDIRSILTMVEELMDEYTIDTSRIFASGLSDGGTFSYAIGLHCPKLFAGIAPIAASGVFPGWIGSPDAKRLPMYVVHGGQDFIFPVAMARATTNQLIENGFNVIYKELPEWGHACTYSINETMVLPWFDNLPSRPGA
ncbi:MAG: hypothetical protein FJ147_06195 [Deltaproteobacteria bacterium]|nr:hypothetical protein [Deltaproteobacteria bacterium]